MQFQATITITLRPSVLDPAGTAVQSGLHQLGHPDVEHVRIGKSIQLELQAPDPDSAHQRIRQMCDQLLANLVIETYQIQLDPVSVEQVHVSL